MKDRKFDVYTETRMGRLIAGRRSRPRTGLVQYLLVEI
jgi:hypothetical protein